MFLIKLRWWEWLKGRLKRKPLEKFKVRLQVFLNQLPSSMNYLFFKNLEKAQQDKCSGLSIREIDIIYHRFYVFFKLRSWIWVVIVYIVHLKLSSRYQQMDSTNSRYSNIAQLCAHHVSMKVSEWPIAFSVIGSSD